MELLHAVNNYCLYFSVSLIKNFLLSISLRLMKLSFARFLTFALTTLAIIFISTKVYAQVPDFLWAKQGSGDKNDVARGVTADNMGNTIATGSFQGKTNLGNQEIISSGLQDIFIAKYDAQGDVAWIKQFGAQGRDFAFDIVDADQRGSSFVTGLFSNTVAFDQFTLKDVGSGDMFTAKIDSSGKVLWAKQAGGLSLDGGNEIVSDSSGNALVIANSYGTVTIEDVILNHQGKQDVFIVKYDPNGKFLWARQIVGLDDERGRGISVDKKDNVLITGEFIGSLSFGTDQVESYSNRKDIFLAKYDSSGKFLWAKSFGSKGEDYGRGIGADASGNIYFSGVFSGSVKFGNKTLNSVGGSKDIFLAKTDKNGNIVWVRQMGGLGLDEGCEIEVDDAGNSYISGGFADSGTFGSTILKSAGFRDVFVAKYDSQGNLLWVKQAGGKGDDEDYAIAVDSAARVTIAGTFTGNATFGDFSVRDINRSVAFFVAQLGKNRN